MVFILMGVSGSGKSLIGRMLADELNLLYRDADEFHNVENIQKMESGKPLNDIDRRSWLETLAEHTKKWQRDGGAVLACSALKQSYREILKSKIPENICFIYLKGSPTLIAKRLAGRSGHFMPTELLRTQFETLEEPEHAITVSVDQSPNEVLKFILKKLNTRKTDCSCD